MLKLTVKFLAASLALLPMAFVANAQDVTPKEGLVIADLKEDFVQSARFGLEEANAGTLAGVVASLRQRAEAWFQTIRDEICAAFEKLETDLPATAQMGDHEPGR